MPARDRDCGLVWGIAIGLVAYGVVCFVEAKYGKAA
jgi:hypothetical protein